MIRRAGALYLCWLAFDSWREARLPIETVPVDRSPSARELALLVSIYVGIATFVHSLIVVLAGGLQAFFAAPYRREMAGNIFAALLLAIAVWLFVSGRR